MHAGWLPLGIMGFVEGKAELGGTAECRGGRADTMSGLPGNSQAIVQTPV